MRKGWFVPLLGAVAAAQAVSALGQVTTAPTTAPVASQPSGPQPKLVLSAERWDFGEVWAGTPTAFDLRLTNAGTADLLIRDVSSSCGCTVAKLSEQQKTLAPGQSTEVHIEFNTLSKRGSIITHVFIQSDDPEQRRVDFQVRGHIKRIVSMTPRSLWLRASDPQDVPTATIRLENQYPQPLPLKISSGAENESTRKTFEVELTEITPGQVFEVTARPKVALSRGIRQTDLALEPGLDGLPKITIPIYAAVKDRVEVSPPAVLVPRDILVPSSRTLLVRYYGKDEKFRVTEVVSPTPEVTAEVKQPAPPKESKFSDAADAPTLTQEVVLAVPPGDKIPEGGWLVALLTNDPGFARIEVQVTPNRAAYRKALSHGAEGQAGREATTVPLIGPRKKKATSAPAEQPVKQPDKPQEP